MRASITFASLMRQCLVVYIPCALVAIGVAWLYVSQEHPAYLWDWGVYWHSFQEHGYLFTSDIQGFLRGLGHSISFEDYNASAVVPFMPIYQLFGGGRVVYVASICALYVVPSAIVASRLASCPTNPEARWTVALVASLLFPVFWNSALRGMVDVVGLLPLGLASILMWKTRFLTAASWPSAGTLGLLLWLTFMLRRWYCFSIVSLVAVSLVAAVVEMMRGRHSIARVGKTLSLWTLAGMVSVTSLVYLQAPLTRRILSINYAKIYSAYQVSLWRHLEAYYRQFGAITLSCVALGLTIDLLYRRPRSAFFFTVALATGLALARVQAPSVQHFLPVALMIYPAFYSGVAFLTRILPSPLHLLVFVFLALNFINNFWPSRLGFVEPLRDYLSTSRYPPLQLENYSEYQRLTQDLVALDSSSRIAVFASSPLLADSLLIEINPDLRRRMIFVAHVDLRDRFYWDSLTSDYFVVARPIPLHLSPDGQRVITYPAEEILNHFGIGLSLEPTGRAYHLADGIIAELYKRARAIPPTDIERLAKRFYALYPHWRYHDLRDAGFMLATASTSPQIPRYAVEKLDAGRISLTTGSRLSYLSGKYFEARTLTVYLDPASLACSGVEVAVLSAAGLKSLVISRESPASFELPDLPAPIEISSSSSDAGCEKVILSFGF